MAGDIVDKVQPLVYKPNDLMTLLGIGRNTTYELLRSGQIRAIKVGRSYLIPKDAVTAYLRGAN